MSEEHKCVYCENFPKYLNQLPLTTQFSCMVYRKLHDAIIQAEGVTQRAKKQGTDALYLAVQTILKVYVYDRLHDVGYFNPRLTVDNYTDATFEAVEISAYTCALVMLYSWHRAWDEDYTDGKTGRQAFEGTVYHVRKLHEEIDAKAKLAEFNRNP